MKLVLVLCSLALMTGCATQQPLIGAQPRPTRLELLPVGATALTAPIDSAALRFRRGASGVALPALSLTPGSVYPDVTAAQVCALHYERSVRDPGPESKIRLYATYGVTSSRPSYSFDHLVPKSLGGDNTDANLWPQPLAAPGALEKDGVERKLTALVCSGAMTLPAAQQALRTDWYAAFLAYGTLPPPAYGGTKPPDPIKNGQPCPVAGAIGYTRNKHVPLTCTARPSGRVWSKRR